MVQTATYLQFFYSEIELNTVAFLVIFVLKKGIKVSINAFQVCLIDTLASVFVTGGNCRCLLHSSESWERTFKVCIQILTMDQLTHKLSKCNF